MHREKGESDNLVQENFITSVVYTRLSYSTLESRLGKLGPKD